MALPNEVNSLLIGAAAQPTGYQIKQSLRYPRSAYLYRTPSTSGNRTTWTYSCWFKRSTLYNDTAGYSELIGTLFAAGQTFNQNDWNLDQFRFRTDYHELSAWLRASDTNQGSIQTLAKYRDCSAWYHVVVVYDSGNATAGDRARFYVNGEQATTTMPVTLGQNRSGWVNSTNVHRIASGTSEHTQGYLAEVHFLDGTAVTDADDFGEYNDDGVWVPKEVSGVTYGTNGFYLTFDPSATNGIGHDHSGNGNNFTPSGFTTSGTGTDVMDDTPTTNWCTLNPVFKNLNTGNIYSEGALVATNGTGQYSFIFNSTIPVSSGKWYAECTMSGYSGTPSPVIGVQDAGNKKDIGNELVGAETGDVGYSLRDGSIYKDGNYSYATGYTTATSGDTIGIKLDLDGNTIEFLKNNTSVGSAIPIATGSGLKVFAGGQGDGSSGIGCVFTWNFGQRAFAYTQPSGYKALNTRNLPAPSIKVGSEYFNTVLWSGDESSPRSITGVGFQPDFVWIKNRSGANDHNFNDVVRGTSNVLASNRTDPENNAYGYVSAFNSDGFSVSDGSSGNGEVNSGAGTYVAWNWIASNTSGSSNTNGSITSTVSANTSAGFSVVQYTGTGSNATVGHGLGVAPKMIIVKNRDEYTSWAVYHKSLGATKYFNLDQYTTAGTSSLWWNDTEPTSTVFSVGTRDETNNSSDRMIAYCFAEVEGYCKTGKYHGNSDGDGAFIYTGFAPAFIMIKGDLGQDWFISDVKRSPYNVTGIWLRPNLANSEINDPNTNGAGHDILSNGFKIRTNTYGLNRDYDYYYIAFAENPFGGFGVSPATAR